jgi:hypothetical protein
MPTQHTASLKMEAVCSSGTSYECYAIEKHFILIFYNFLQRTIIAWKMCKLVKRQQD